MVIDTKMSNNKNRFNKSSEVSTNELGRSIENYSIIALFCFISAIFLITFDNRFVAGCLIIVGASLGILIFRKTSALSRIFNKSLNDISSSNEKKDYVINEFSHKIREPLNNLVSLVNMLQESGMSHDQKELVDSFSVSTNKMVTSVNELTMQSAGNLSYEHRKAIRFNLLSALLNTIDLYSLKEQDKIDFIVKNKGFSDFECYGDPIILKQIFLDIFNTIEKGESERALRVKINLVKEKEEGAESFYFISICLDRNNVLIENTGTEQSKAAFLISKIKGIINLEISEYSMIWNLRIPFTNPVFNPEEKIVSPGMKELILKDKTHKQLKDLKLLLVEDSLVNQKITILTLKPHVKAIDTAINGKEALDKFGLTEYDLILMDIQLPLMTGLEAVEKIRVLESSTDSHVPIIAVTANAMIGDREKCLSAGIDDYISKPFQPDALIEIIKKNI